MAWDNGVAVPNVQGAIPNMASTLLNYFTNTIGGLSDDFYRGAENKRQYDLGRAFKDGLPRDAQGNVDYQKVTDTLARLGDVNAVAQLAPLEQRQQYVDYLRNQTGGQADATVPSGSATGIQPGIPSVSRPPVAAAPPQMSPQATPATYSGGDAGSGTVASISTSRLGDRYGKLGVVIDNVAKAAGVDPNAPLDDAQQARVSRIVDSYATRNNVPAPQPSPNTRIADTFNALPPAPGGANAPQAAPQAAPPAAPIGAAGQSAQNGQVVPRQTQPSPNGEPVAKLPATSPAADAIVPSSYRGRALEYAQEQDRIADSLSQRAEIGAALGYNTQGALARATAARQRAQTVREALAKDAALTPGMREWTAGRRPGESQADYEARAAGEKEAAVAPYQIAAAAIREGGRPIAIHPNEVVTTGNAVNPALSSITNWAADRLGIPAESTAAPNQAAGAPGQAGSSDQSSQSAFTPRLVRNPDGSVASSVTPSTEMLQKTAAENYEKARETYNGAEETKMQLASMENAFRELNRAGWSTTGSGAEARLRLAKAINSVWSVMGVKGENLPFDPEKIGRWEELTKDTTRLGFALARTLGAREAMQIVQGAIRANPNVENSPLGARMVLNTIRQNADRQTEYFEFATRFAQTHGGDLVGAEVAFNKANPPSLYARRAIVQARRDIPQEAIDQLRQDPSQAAAFDQHYGATGLAALFLGAGAAEPGGQRQ